MSSGVKSTARRLSKRLLLILISSCLALFVADAILRVSVVESMVPEDDASFQRLIAAKWPNPVEKTKPDGVYRILGLADSFGEAGGPRN